MRKTINNIALAAILLTGIFTSCSLDEYNPSTIGLETAYKYKDGYEGLINSCYVDLYLLYGKIDGIGAMEAGSDLWVNSGNSETGFILYNSNMNTSLGTLRVLWQSLYATVNYCNTAILYADRVEEYTAEQRNAKVAEAHFLRAWANFHLVEQFGNVVLNRRSMIETGAVTSPQRSTELEFYELIISDLQFACEHLPLTQPERGRVTRKAAYAMLAKAALQRTRLGDKDTYAKMALDAAEELINNQSKYNCALYKSDDNQSGYAKLWAEENNKANSEFLFLEAIEEVDYALNPEGNNRGRTRQYYLMDLRTVGAVWGTIEREINMGRANSRSFKPTKYLMTEIFDPRENTPDTRYANTFFYKYYNASGSNKAITQSMIDQYGKSQTLLNHSIVNTFGTPNPNTNLFGLRRSMAINMDDDKGLSVFTPNWTIPSDQKALMPCLVADPSDLFQSNGMWTENTQLKEVHPSLRKFSAWKFCNTEQYWLGDFPILRLGETYLVAAEAAVLLNNKDKAAAFVNEIRRRAAVKSREAEMVVPADQMTVDFILKERGRELAGEQYRWYDLKRTGKLTKEYLSATNPAIIDFDPAKHTVRPVPISFLNAIANADEFGTNGY